MGIYLIPLSNVVERVCSTVYATIYENYFSMTLVIALCVVPWLLSAFLSVHLFFIRYYFDVTYVYMVYELAATGLYIAYFYLCYQERKKQKNSIGVLSLTERYQRAENQKCIQTILRFALSSVISLVLTVVYSLVVLYVLPKYLLQLSLDDKIAYFRQLINECVSIVTFTLPIHFAHINPGLFKQYKNALRRLFCPLKRPISSTPIASTNSAHQVVSITGKNLVPQDETHFHFDALNNVWNS
uniref:G protein-coupled receptor n=1 Tax=Panagrellus redivivus TaxID=6233 RepID=A0A7E4V742_PANRE